MLFSSLPHNVYLVFLMKSTITAKETRLNKKSIGISLGFAYIKYKIQEATLKSAILNLPYKTINKTAEIHK